MLNQRESNTQFFTEILVFDLLWFALNTKTLCAMIFESYNMYILLTELRKNTKEKYFYFCLLFLNLTECITLVDKLKC